MRIKLDLFQLEKQRIELLQNLVKSNSVRLKFYSVFNYYNNLFDLESDFNKFPFLAEFIEQYVQLFEQLTPYYYHPNHFKKIIEVSKKLLFFDYSDELNDINQRLKNSIDNFCNKLEIFETELKNGKLSSDFTKFKFPVIENISFKDRLLVGFLESISVSIKKASKKNKFIITPNIGALDDKIENQIQICWNHAIRFLKNFTKKPFDFHEVIISFDERAGLYTGDSLGTSLTIAFIEQLFLFYNSEIIIYLKPGVTLTGGINDSQELISVSENIIRKKTEIVFFSYSDIFVVPKKDENAALAKLDELKKEFPNRNLTIIGIDNLEDLFNRRNIVDIKKLSIIKKTTNKLKRNWKAAAIIGILSLVIGFFVYQDWDDNPAMLEVSGNTTFVKNKSGKVLWTHLIPFSHGENSNDLLKYLQKIVDIDNDGINEVLLVANHESEFKAINKSEHKIVCIDKNKNVLWHYAFTDKITSELGKLDTNYAVFLIDTATVNNQKVLLCFSNNSKSFSSAIFQLDLKTGKRVNNALWNSGFFTNGFIKDFDNDGKNELIASFVNNGYEQIGILKIEIDKLNGQCPTTTSYRYKNLPIADLEQYILFPKTDYSKYINIRMEGIRTGSMLFGLNKKINIDTEIESDKATYTYFYNYNKNNFEIMIGNGFRVMRDSLVVKGELNPPLTDTEEYCNLLLSQIKYWNGIEFVYRKEISE